MMRSINHLLLAGGVLAGLFLLPSASAQEHERSGSDDKPWSQADAYYGAEKMDASRARALHHNGGQQFAMIMLDRAEVQFADDEELGVWDGSLRYGGDIDKLYVKSEGEYSFEHQEFEDAEIQLLWSHAVSAYFDAQAGVRYDIEPDGLAHAAIGFQGLAPYWFEVDGAAYVSEKGDLTADFEVEYDFLLTQRLILQPRAEFLFSAQDISERHLGSGLTHAEAGLRLRYEIAREFAPYVGVEHRVALGGTGDLLDAAGGDAEQTVWVIGLRTWY